MKRMAGWVLGDTRHVVAGHYIGDRVPTERRPTPAEQVVWAAIICHDCGRRLYRDDGTAIRSWRRLLGC